MPTLSRCITLPLVAILLAGCASDLSSVRLGTRVDPVVVPGKIFIPSTTSTANVGEVMLTAGEYSKEASASRIEAFRVPTETRVSTRHKSSIFEFLLTAGDYRLHSRANGGSYYSAPASFLALNNETKIGYGGLFVPEGSAAATEFYWNWRPNMDSVHQAKLAFPIQGTTVDSVVSLGDQENSGPRATLTYAGVAAGQIRFVYKEFTREGLARPAYTQEVSLDYRPGGLYAYKDAQFTVESADSTHIRFTLIRPL